MEKEKSKKSTPENANSLEGKWPIFIREELVYIGHLNLIQVSASPEHYVAAMQFDENPQFSGIANSSFPVQISTFDPSVGYFEFKILGAAKLYNSDTSPAYRFVFQGNYKAGELVGTAKVPRNFGKVPGLPGEDGDDVTWTSKGLTDPPHKPSR